MNFVFIGILGLIFTSQHVNANCVQSKEFESNCGSYCFQVLKPILDHVKIIQQKYDALQHINKIQESPEIFEKKLSDLIENVVKIGQKIEQKVEVYLANFETRIMEKADNHSRLVESVLGQQADNYGKLLSESSKSQQLLSDMMTLVNGKSDNQTKLVGEVAQNQTSLAKIHFDSLKDEISNKLQQQGSKIINKLNILKLGLVTVSRPSKRPEFKKIGSKYYYIEESNKLKWWGAYLQCLSYDSHLVSFKSQYELSNITEKLQPNLNYWIDFTDLEEDRKFISSTTGQEPTFLNWHSGEPSNSPFEHCGDLWYNSGKHLMNDNTCSNEQLFICEYFRE